MSEPLSKSDQELLGQMARFTEKRAVNSVYMLQGISQSLNCPVLFLCALGEQALKLQTIISGAAERDNVIQMPAARNFITGGENGGER